MKKRVRIFKTVNKPVIVCSTNKRLKSKLNALHCSRVLS